MATCPHYAMLDAATFRQLIYDKLCDGDSDTTEIDLSTVRGVARANASTHFKIGKREIAKKQKKKRKKSVDEDDDEGSKNAMLLHCEVCATVDGGANNMPPFSIVDTNTMQSNALGTQMV